MTKKNRSGTKDVYQTLQMIYVKNYFTHIRFVRVLQFNNEYRRFLF